LAPGRKKFRGRIIVKNLEQIEKKKIFNLEKFDNIWQVVFKIYSAKKWSELSNIDMSEQTAHWHSPPALF
jgi:hypothetical protein